MTERIIISGAGGQGIMLLGKIIALAAMEENKFVTWLPAYGAEVRGGSSYCMVTMSDSEVGSPSIDKADTFILMNKPSLEKFKNKINQKSLLILNSSLIKKNNAPDGLSGPFSGIAIDLGNIKVANMVALGFYLAHKRILSINTVFKVIENIAPADKKELIEINKKALSAGEKLANTATREFNNMAI